ncbi:unnamed protein product [Vitrella brassicaformis CCMP3155]|uniref:Uncharacterized protein n=3 Tax=Vitrella brassicaformis TaxID=1169539 RepID=A0A0G4F1I8_VITBC|nr:unnamed protein product [Vitrella brassicaformis CCMP3155]|eukprot:CEM05767.1 unnamed protein product [Vitrella brassicaformis CCMP3155]
MQVRTLSAYTFPHAVSTRYAHLVPDLLRLAGMLDNEEAQFEGCSVLQMMARYSPKRGIPQLIKRGAVPALVGHLDRALVSAPDSAIRRLLTLLQTIVLHTKQNKVADEEAGIMLSVEAFDVMVELMGHESEDIQMDAALVLKAMAIDSKYGLEKVVEPLAQRLMESRHALAKLAPLLSSPNPELRQSAVIAVLPLAARLSDEGYTLGIDKFVEAGVIPQAMQGIKSHQWDGSSLRTFTAMSCIGILNFGTDQQRWYGVKHGCVGVTCSALGVQDLSRLMLHSFNTLLVQISEDTPLDERVKGELQESLCMEPITELAKTGLGATSIQAKRLLNTLEDYRPTLRFPSPQEMQAYLPMVCVVILLLALYAFVVRPIASRLIAAHRQWHTDKVASELMAKEAAKKKGDRKKNKMGGGKEAAVRPVASESAGNSVPDELDDSNAGDAVQQQQQSQQQQAAAAEKSVKSATTIAMATNEAALDQEHTSASTSAWTSARRRKGKNNKAKAGSTSSVGHSGGQESSSRHPAPPATMAIVAATTTAPVTTPKNIATPAFLTQASLTSMASNSTACSPTHHNGHSNSHSNSNGCNGRGGAAGHVNESWREFEEAWNEWDAARSSSPAPAQQTPSKPPSLRDHDGAVSSHWPALPPSTGGAAPRRAPHRVVAGGPAAAPVREAVVQLTAALLKKQSCESSYDALLDTRTRLTDRKGQLQESIRQLKNHGTSTHKLTREALLALASPTDVRAFAARIGEEDKRLDALYRQAATMYHHQQQQGTAGGQNGGVGVSSPPCKGMAPSPAPPSADEIVSGLLRGAPTDEQVRQATKWTTNEIDELDRRISDLQSECATLEVELRDLEHQRYVLQSKADEGLTAHRLSSLISATPAAIAAFMHEIATAKTHLRELAKQATRQETALLHKQQAANRVKETLTSCSCVSCRKAAAVVTFFPCNQRCLCESCWQEWRGRHERAKDEMGRLQAEGMPVPQSVRCYARTLWCPACGKDALRAE